MLVTSLNNSDCTEYKVIIVGKESHKETGNIQLTIKFAFKWLSDGQFFDKECKEFFARFCRGLFSGKKIKKFVIWNPETANVSIFKTMMNRS